MAHVTLNTAEPQFSLKVWSSFYKSWRVSGQHHEISRHIITKPIILMISALTFHAHALTIK